MSHRRALSQLVALSAASLASAQLPQFTRTARSFAFPAPGGSPTAHADFDGDGDNDVVCAGALFVNEGGHGFRSQPVGVMPTSLGAYAAGDLDGDGDADVAFGPRLALNDGAGSFSWDGIQAPAVPYGLGDPVGVALGDFDGDGDLDVITGWVPYICKPPYEHCTTGGLSVWRNEGGAVFIDWTAQAIPSPLACGGPVALADVDGDLDLDLFTGSEHSQCLWINDGTGRFQPNAPPLPAAPTFVEPRTCAIADLDSDGDADLLLAGVVAYENLGAGAFVDASARLQVTGIRDIAEVADVDGDGRNDIVTVEWFAEAVLLHQNASGGFDRVELPSIVPYLESIELLDADGDGDLDAYFSSGAAGELLLQQAGALVSIHGAPNALKAFPTDVVVADFDGDVVLDALVGIGEGMQFFLGIGNGAFRESATVLPVVPGQHRQLFPADVDGDTDVDVLISTGGLNTYTKHLWLNDGLGSFSDATSQLSPASQEVVLAVADIDGDSDIDALCGAQAQPCRVLLNDGTGVFTAAAAPWPSSTLDTLQAEFVDLEGDGDLDAITIEHTVTHRLRTFFNDGSGVFSVGGQLAGAFDSVRDVLDVDRDGDSDVLATITSAWQLLRNDGSGKLTLEPGSYASIRAAMDFNDDGAPDLLHIAQNYPLSWDVLLNNGAGVWNNPQPLAIEGSGYFVPRLLLDLDGDGDRDLLSATSHLEILHNTERHLAWRTLPRPGGRLELDIRGTPGAEYLLLGAHQAGLRPFGAYGTLRVKLASLALRRHGHLDGQGRALETFEIANDPALAGTSLYWQALIANPRRLTNLEVTTFVER